MKGKKAYFFATLLHEKLHKYPNDLDEDERISVYYEYFKLIKESAYLGYTDAFFDLGQQYESMGFLGINNPKYNPKKCIYWYSKACNNGHAEACNNLASFYEEGIGCELDLNKALELYKRSAELGSVNGKKNYRIMIKDISKGDIYEKKNVTKDGDS
ncbi:tetratricopeptide repeat protein [Pedobacter metabolipauper]|uniref:Sel1 repeat-containing protein n=1 Tax=Pedobacter metabolipauper TaxID=425513 RepID=A0A4R6SPJ1_9SPHI|nr:tetratricopeptide repeat protein [Pedobacter metabolipauper]TDQ06547.1 hypothetical protein ATK78_4203 [Pedobacter metabolipauper]